MTTRTRRKTATPASAQPMKAVSALVSGAIKIKNEVLAKSRIRPKTPKGAEPIQVNPFRVAEHPPSALPPSDHRMAQDESIEASLAWAAQAYGGDDGVESVGFLGYPYLVALAQRPEYRRISETIATEMTRRWIKLTAVGNDDKTEKLAKIEAALKRYGVRDLFRRCAEQDGFFGRAHLFVDLGADTDTELSTPIGSGRDDASCNKIGKGSLKGFRTVEAVWAYPQEYDTANPLSPSWYRPARWFVQGRNVHATRLLTFIGREVPDLIKPAYSFGGLAMSQIAKPYVDNWLRTRQGVSDLIVSFAVSGIKIDLASALANGAGDDLFNRIDLFNNLRDNRNTMVLNKGTGPNDPGEEFFNVSTPLGGLDKLQAQSQEHMASVSGIPLVKLLGVTPSGLNASTDGEIRVFYDFIHAYQDKLFTANLDAVLGIIQLSEFGEIDPDIGYVYEALWSLDEKGAAEVRKIEADTDAVLIGANTISVSEARHRLSADDEAPYASLKPDETPALPEDKRVTVAAQKATVVIQAAAEGLCPDPAAMRSLRDTGLFPHLTEADIVLAEANPPAPDNDEDDEGHDPVEAALAAAA